MESDCIRREVSGRGLTYRLPFAAAVRRVPRPTSDKPSTSVTTTTRCFAQVRPYTFQKTSDPVNEVRRLPKSDLYVAAPCKRASSQQQAESRLFTDTDTGILRMCYEVQYAFKISMTHLIMQFALRIAVRSVLHRWLSLDIHC